MAARFRLIFLGRASLCFSFLVGHIIIEIANSLPESRVIDAFGTITMQQWWGIGIVKVSIVVMTVARTH